MRWVQLYLIGGSGKTSPVRRTQNEVKDLNEGHGHMYTRGKDIPARGSGACIGPEAGVALAGWKTLKEAGVSGLRCARGRVGGVAD